MQDDKTKKETTIQDVYDDMLIKEYTGDDIPEDRKQDIEYKFGPKVKLVNGGRVLV